MRTRAQALDALERGESGDILIIGGGINGVGVFRDLAAQGVGATLVEMGDFCSGTSAAPSRLIHGGLRYLEQGEFKLVRESVEERDRLLKNAPHQVRPIRVWVPALSWAGGTLQAALRFLRLMKDPGPKGALILKLGLTIFDGFSIRDRSMPRHRLVPRRQAFAKVRGLANEIRIVAEYFDARIDSPERLTLELVDDAEAACPESLAIPYLKLVGVEGDTALLQDVLSGRIIRKRCRFIINCAGAWIDHVDRDLGIGEGLVGGTRGSHLVLKRPDLAADLGDVMLYFETPDFRACLIYRLDADHVLLGTTDIRTEHAGDKETSEAEIDYLFDVIRTVLPKARPRREDIAFAYSGVRPLPRQAAGAAGSISRDHTFRTFEPTGTRTVPVLTLIGGKWTTYRACAEQIVDLVLPRLGQDRRVTTADLPIGGGTRFPRDPAGLSALATELMRTGALGAGRAERLLKRYGTRAARMAASLRGETPLRSAACYSREEILWIAQNERVTRLDDMILRRTLMAFEGVASEACLMELADLLAPALSWSPERCQAEVDATRLLLENRHRARRQVSLEDA
ncbi:glycerol-3-phosphate dehydrogenase/oxidase [Rhizobium straminoryzae]|uniref:Glycerol-3-phosphate dehydrogenase/oxidase n=1 Tax=Rhizobium straminoryzae TaxID=1387186 RepID=A0A549THF0_9HYPH|nr:glycerol-3-phosphate dehydrogenase/oxidase [Rhizobium straminoryzae]TRL42449.1 glycerol-3-phosphate dehydrogenase/oxidase [Rhizobium straminoryzae]